jgi:hypothetical protein
MERVYDGLFDVALVVSRANHVNAVAWYVVLDFLSLKFTCFTHTLTFFALIALREPWTR